MTSNLVHQIDLTSKATSLAIAPPISKVANVSTLRGQQLFIPEHQVPLVNPNAVVTNTWYFNADGNYQTALQNAGIQNIKISRGQGSGKTTGKVWLRMNITNTSLQNVQTNPVPFWFNNIQFQTPGGDVIQTRYAFDLWLSILACTPEEEWQSISDLILASNNYESGQPIPAGTTFDVWMPLYGNPYSCGEIATRELEGDSMVYLTFNPPSQFIESGPTNALVVNSMSLVFEMQQLDQSLIRALDAEYASFPHSSIYPWVRVQEFTQTFTANTQYTFQLSGISGDVAFLMFVLRENTSAWDAYHGNPITDFQIQNQEGVAISGSAFIPENYNRWGQLTRWFLGTWMQDRRYYGWNFSQVDSAPVEFLSTGRKNGAFGFTTNEQLVIDTAPAGQNEVIRFQTANAGVPTAGSVIYFQWIDEYGATHVSGSYDIDDATFSAAAVKALIEAIPGFEGEVTVAAPTLVPQWGFNVTFIGNYGNRPITAANFSLVSHGVVQTAGGATSLGVPVPSVGGIRGITNGGTYTLTVIAYTSAILSISCEKEGGKGRQKVQRSG